MLCCCERKLKFLRIKTMDKYVTKRAKVDEVNNTDVHCLPEENNNNVSNSGDSETQANPKRKFRSEWLNYFTWLQEKDGSAYCVACSKSLTCHLTHLKAHDKSALHIQNYNVQKRNLKIDKFFNAEEQKRQKQVTYAEYTLVMFCITHNLPFLLMDYLPALLVECCPDSSIAKLLRCGRTKSTQIADYIGKQASEGIVSLLKKRRFSLIVDETTDVSSIKCLVLVARYFDSAIGIQDKFLAMLRVAEADAETICKLIKDFLASCNIPLQNLIGLATDGANVMAGDIRGLKTLLSRETDLFYIKCTCHSLSLCSKYACKKLPTSIESLCRKIYAFFSHSPKRIDEFKEFQEYCAVKPHKILGICGTRWLSLEGVINRIVEQWDSLKLYFISCMYEMHGFQPVTIAEDMTCVEKCYFLFLSYILPIINNLNKEFQSECSRLPYLYSSIKTNFLLILSNFIKKDVINMFSGTQIDYKNQINQIEILKIFIGTKAENFTVKLTKTEIFEVKSNVLNFYVEFLDQIKKRFDFERDDIKLLNIITPEKVISSEDLPILSLIQKFHNLVDCDPDLIITQWNLLRLSEINISTNLNIDSFWMKINKERSAAAERKFSTLSLVKNKLRNKLELDSINSIMLCKEVVHNTTPHYVWSANRDLTN